MRLRSLRMLAVGVIALVLLAGGATALAKSGSSPSGPAANGPGIDGPLLATVVGPDLAGTRVARVVGSTAVDCRFPVPIGDPLQAAADFLGLSVDQLRQDLQDGKSLAEVAKAQGKSVDGLEQALIDAAKADLDKRVAAGDVTAEQEQQMLSEARSHIDDFVNQNGAAPFPPPAPPLGDPLAAAADYLGLSVDQLGQELDVGKSLADVAKAQGKSVAGLEQAIIGAAKSSLDKRVAAGDITADEEQQMLSQLNSQIDDFVNGNGGLSIRIGGVGLEVRIGGPGAPGVLDGPYNTAADYLGLSVEQLTKELQAGKSLAEIAAERGKPVDGLKQALVQAETADIERSVDDLVNQKGLPGPPCGENVAGAAGFGVQVPVPAGTP